MLHWLTQKKTMKSPNRIGNNGQSSLIKQSGGIIHGSTSRTSGVRVMNTGANNRHAYTASIRSNFTSLVNLMVKIKPRLTEEHIKFFEISPFRNIIMCAYHGYILEHHVLNVGGDIRDVINCFDSRTGYFTFGSFKVKPTVDDVRRLLGIMDGRRQVNENRTLFNSTSFYERQGLFKAAKEEGKRLTATIVRKQLMIRLEGERGTDYEDVGRLMTMYVMATLVLTPKSGFLPWWWLKYVDHHITMQSFNWSHFILKTTMSSLKKPRQLPYSH